MDRHKERGKCVIAVFGPTGVGKTAVGVELAVALGIPVISCDSLQLYRGLPILTNQPSPRELALAPHKMVAVSDPEEEWSAARYAEAVQPLIQDSLARRGRALLVGGTGLYMRAALAPLATAPPVPRTLQSQLEQRLATEGLPALACELARLDPEAAATVDLKNPRRVLRAMGVVLAGQRLGEKWSGRADLWQPDYHFPTLVVGLVMERGELYQRINLRTRQMLAQGAIEEVKAVLERWRFLQLEASDGPEAPTRGVGKAIGFRLIKDYLDGHLAYEELEARLAASTRAYARRQLTWMRKMRDVVIMDAHAKSPKDLAGDIIALAEARAG